MTGLAKWLYSAIVADHIVCSLILLDVSINPTYNTKFFLLNMLGSFFTLTLLPTLNLLARLVGGYGIFWRSVVQNLAVPFLYSIFNLVIYTAIYFGFIALPDWWNLFSITLYNIIFAFEILTYSLKLYFFNTSFSAKYKNYNSTIYNDNYLSIKGVIHLMAPFFLFGYLILLIRLTTLFQNLWLTLIIIISMSQVVVLLGIFLREIKSFGTIAIPDESQEHLDKSQLDELRMWFNRKNASNFVFEEKRLNELIEEWSGGANKPYLKQGITVGEVADQIGVPPKVLSLYLNNSLRINFNTWINSLRIEDVKKLLAHKEFTLEEIAMECGFADRSLLSRTFKKIEGCTPIQYRQQCNS